jgi:ATP-binding cassette subfamily B multidrug efflux pump
VNNGSSTAAPGRFFYLTKHLKRYKGYLIAGGIVLVLTNGLMLLTPYISKIVVDLLEAGADMSKVGQWVLIMVGLSIAAGVFRFLTRRTIIWMSRKTEYDLRGEVVGHLMKLSPVFYDNNRTGDMMVRATSDVEAVRMMVGPGIMHISNTVITVLIAIPMMVYLSPVLTLYAMLPAVIMPFIVNRLGNLVHRKSMRIQEHFSDLTATAQENLAGIRVVKAYGQEDAEAENFARMSKKYLHLNVDLGKVQAAFYPLIQFIGLALTLVVLYVGGRRVVEGAIPLGTIVAFLGYLGMLVWPLIAVGWVVSLYQRGMASLERINRVLNTEPQIVDTPRAVTRDHIDGKIEIRNLSFAYDGIQILKDINLTVEAGQMVGLLGLTGSGKTTLVSLLARLYPVEPGRIFIDGVDINEWQLESLRRKIGFATQEPFLFSDTIRANIAFGRDKIDDVEVEKAARIAALSRDLDTFPKGYDTIVGERGITLSGGQKQRTAIARALLTKPSILILDDATSSVDTETEHEINENIQEHSRDLTTLIISHRVSSVKEADFVVYLDDGRIAEQGTHADLLKRDGLYAELYRSQLLEMELEQL